jgi:hypothetical protein
MAGGYLFMADEGSVIGGHFESFPQGVPMIAVTTAEEQPRRIAESRGLASRAAPVFAGRRMYLAGSDQIVCIERPEALGDKLSEYELAALKTGFFTREIGPTKAEAGEAKLTPPANFTVGEGVPVVKLESGKTPNQWMFAGPFFVDEYTAVLGADSRPTVGQTVNYDLTNGQPATVTWRVLDPKTSTYDPKTARAKFDATRHIIMADYAQALGNPRLTGLTTTLIAICAVCVVLFALLISPPVERSALRRRLLRRQLSEIQVYHERAASGLGVAKGRWPHPCSRWRADKRSA